MADGETQQLEDEDEIQSTKQRYGCQRIFFRCRILLLGQVISFVLSLTGAAQATLSFQCSISAPTFTTGIIYICLLVVFLMPVSRHSHILDASRITHRFFHIPLHASPWFYALVGLADFYGNFFTNWAYKFTTITSVVLFDALAIPTTMVLSRIFLQRQYVAIHIFGVVTCIVGVVMNVFADYRTGKQDLDESYASNRLLGDFLAIIGGMLYGVDDMLCELSVRRLGGVKEFLFMTGFFGSVVAIIQAFIMERDEISWFFGSDVLDPGGGGGNTCSRGTAWLLLLGFVVTNVVCYISIALFLQASEAAFLNISLLTGDLWSVLFSVVAQKILPAPFFFLALTFVISGVLIYEMAPTPALEDRVGFKQNQGEDEDNPLGELQLTEENPET
mmetsp:Transcript_15738/g.24162  ORF Transcript_15738/g.24162 Transcript_15738/m.24162 type:complete len:389 (+) Transcript_15738:132-1298(+)